MLLLENLFWVTVQWIESNVLSANLQQLSGSPFNKCSKYWIVLPSHLQKRSDSEMPLWGPLLIQVIKLWSSTDCIKMLVYWWLKIAKICFPLYTSWFYHCKSNVHLKHVKHKHVGKKKDYVHSPNGRQLFLKFWYYKQDKETFHTKIFDVSDNAPNNLRFISELFTKSDW